MDAIAYRWTHPNPNNDPALRGERTWIFHPDMASRLVSSAMVGGKSRQYTPPAPFYIPIRQEELLGQPFDDVLLRLSPEWAETKDEFMARASKRGVPPDALDIVTLDKKTIPADRTFRNAWALTGGRLGVDMPKARELWRDKMRAARKPLLEALDVEMSRAFSDTVEQTKIEAKRQALRDVTADPAIEAAQTPDALKDTILNILG